jgi:hypothetical protein
MFVSVLMPVVVNYYRDTETGTTVDTISVESNKYPADIKVKKMLLP